MIKADLSHNPYLLITKAKFNEREPRINNQIEKYDTKPLKSLKIDNFIKWLKDNPNRKFQFNEL